MRLHDFNSLCFVLLDRHGKIVLIEVDGHVSYVKKPFDLSCFAACYCRYRPHVDGAGFR